MLPEPTVLILGAGASVPYKFPTATELREWVLGKEYWERELTFPAENWLDDIDAAIRRTLERESGTPDHDLQHFRSQFFQSQFQSLDAFIQRRAEFDRVGKISIACALLFFERLTRINQQWYSVLLSAIHQSNPDDWTDNLKVVTFNYDRSFEFFFGRSFAAIYQERAAELFGKVEICHVYGDLASLSEVPWGGLEHSGTASSRIYLARDVPACALKISDWIEAATRIWFLGFSFGAENIRFLRYSPIGKRVIASAFHLAESDKRRANIAFGQIEWGGYEEDILSLVSRHGF